MRGTYSIPCLEVAVCIFVLSYLISFPALAWETKRPDLAEKWEEMVGFKASESVGKVAPAIRPGLVIDSTNYKNYPGLKELLPESLYTRLDSSSYAPLAPITIKETDQYHLSEGWMEATIRSMDTIRLGEDNLTVLGYHGGVPFVHPKSGNELVQWVEYFYAGDSLAFRPMRMRLYGRDNKPEREMRQHVNNLLYYGCTDWREVKENPQKLHHVASGVFTYPRDISGTSYVRKRYIDADTPDAFLIYVPSMRRIRKMSGRDMQDPLFGSDLVWDDYKLYWQKLSQTEFPNEYTMLPEREMLVPTYVDYNWPDDRDSAGYKGYYIDESGDQTYLHFGSWQRRPMIPVEIVSLDPGYIYSKRVVYNDKEVTTQSYTDMYDQSGRLFRSALMTHNLSGEADGMMWDFDDIVDVVNNHRTILDFKGERNPTWMGEDFADLRFLSRKAK